MSELDLASIPLRSLLAAVDDRTLAAELLLRARRARTEGIAGIRRVRAAVARLYGLRPADLAERRRIAGAAEPRMLAMFLAREQGYSLPQIGRALNRHHTTVLHACRVVAASEDLQTAMSLALLRWELRGVPTDG